MGAFVRVLGLGGGVLLASFASVGVFQAVAQDATWGGGLDFNSAQNWRPQVVPTGTAFFPQDFSSQVSFSADTKIDSWIFRGIPKGYAFANDRVLTFSGNGIINGDGISINNSSGTLLFSNSSTAGGATISNNTGDLFFLNASSGGGAVIANYANLQFQGTSTAGNATITNERNLQFLGTSSAGSASITNRSVLRFRETSTAGNAAITNSRDLQFEGASTAGSATITGNVSFIGRSTAGSATITGNIDFRDTTTAGSAVLAGDSETLIRFRGTSTAGNATITNNATLEFQDTSSAGSATIINNQTVRFLNASTGGAARLVNGRNAHVSLSGISGGTSLGSIEGYGTINLDNITLTVGSNNLSTTFFGSLLGRGSFVKTGTGTLTFDGALVQGDVTVEAGVLSTRETALVGVVKVLRGATLRGDSIEGNVAIQGGEIAPGNSIGNLTINGGLLLAGGIYEVEIRPNRTDDIILIGPGGRATIDGGVIEVLASPGTYVPNTTYTIMTASQGVTGSFSGVTSDFAFLTPTLSYDANNVYLSLLLLPNAFRSAGQTVNQQAVGGALDAIAATGSVGGLITTMANLNAGQGAPALQALSGQPYADFGTMNMRGGQLFMNAVGRQMAVDRGNGPGPRSVALAEACAVSCDGTAVPRLGAWLSAIGSTGNVLGDANAAGLTYTFGGAAFGIDYRLDPRFLVGIAGGYVSGMQWVNGFTGTGYVDSFNVGLYASFNQGGTQGDGFYADALAGYANATNRLQRVINTPGLPTGITNGSTGANQFLGQVETGYRIGLGFPANTSISPFARFQVGAANQAGFTESGASLYNLTVASQNTTSVRSTLGVDFAAGFDLGGGTPLNIGLRLGWLHEYADTSRPMTAAFAAAPGGQFTVFGATPQRDSAVIGLSAVTTVSDRLALYLNYDGEVGGGTDNHALRAGFRLTW